MFIVFDYVVSVQFFVVVVGYMQHYTFVKADITTKQQKEKGNVKSLNDH